MDFFYDPRQQVDDNASFSPSAGKPRHVVASWQALGLPLVRHGFAPAAPAELALAHDPGYVAGVLAGKLANGFGNTLPSVAAALPWVVGSFVAAARFALLTGETAASPTSGFHHAGYNRGGGFCTFNGLAVAAHVLRRDERVGRVAVVDLDMHYGDGTADILARTGADFVRHYTFGAEGVNAGNAERWLAGLPATLEKLVAGCDVVFYQAGADPHIDDPLGGVLTSEQLARRDRSVFATCASLGVPVAWNLAGGYQQPLRKVLDVHDRTMREAVSACRGHRGVGVGHSPSGSRGSEPKPSFSESAHDH